MTILGSEGHDKQTDHKLVMGGKEDLRPSSETNFKSEGISPIRSNREDFGQNQITFSFLSLPL